MVNYYSDKAEQICNNNYLTSKYQIYDIEISAL